VPPSPVGNDSARGRRAQRRRRPEAHSDRAAGYAAGSSEISRPLAGTRTAPALGTPSPPCYVPASPVRPGLAELSRPTRGSHPDTGSPRGGGDRPAPPPRAPRRRGPFAPTVPRTTQFERRSPPARTSSGDAPVTTPARISSSSAPSAVGDPGRRRGSAPKVATAACVTSSSPAAATPADVADDAESANSQDGSVRRPLFDRDDRAEVVASRPCAGSRPLNPHAM